jgi:hypothetical protein
MKIILQTLKDSKTSTEDGSGWREIFFGLSGRS